MRGEWIEIFSGGVEQVYTQSPLMRGEWIEIAQDSGGGRLQRSPLMRGEWIEIMGRSALKAGVAVSPHARGVD